MQKALLFLLLLSVSACQNQPTGSSRPLRISINSWIGFAPFYIALEKNYFLEQGLEVEISRIEDTGGRRSALIAGRVDALGSTIDDFVVGLAQGLDAKMVLLVDDSYGGDGILALDKIRTIPELAGKRIGVQPGFVNHFFLLYLLDKNGLSPDAVTIVPMEPDKAAIALLNKEIDAAVTWEPHLSLIKSQKGYHLLITSADSSAQKVILDNLIISSRTARERPADVQKLLIGWFKALDFLKHHPEEATAIIAKNFDLPPAEAQSMLRGLRYATLPENYAFFNPGNPSNAIDLSRKAAELYFKSGVIDSLAQIGPLESRFDSSFLPKNLHGL